MGRTSWLDRTFREHPRSLGVGYLTHMRGAVGIGARLLGAGAACMVHAVVPGVMTDRASRTLGKLHDGMRARHAGERGSAHWLDYEI